MIIRIKTQLEYSADQPCDVLLQIEVARDDVQESMDTILAFGADPDQREVSGEDGIGTRRWVRTGENLTCTYETIVHLNRAVQDLGTLDAVPVTQLPAEVVKYLLPSRYCHIEDFVDPVAERFGDQAGGQKIQSMSDWITQSFSYVNDVSDSATTASESFQHQAGVCRDYAHVLIAMARCAGIPARFVSAYAASVKPPDFHAVVEVYLESGWQLIDPTGMATPEEIVRIGVGRDAADASFLTSYGWLTHINQAVSVERID